MADSLIDLDTGPLAEERNEAAKAKVEDFDADSGSGDCDYSSGSDRSFEGEDDNIRDDETEVCTRSRRRRSRHNSTKHGSRRHKGGSRHKHKSFQPYPTKEELSLKRQSKELQEKENAAAVVRQEGASDQIVAFPIAPFNSTQFLMDEHNVASPATNLPKNPSNSRLSNPSPMNGSLIHSVASTPAEPHQDVISQTKDEEFTDIYATALAESLQSLSKEELVKYYMNLEEKVASLQKKVAKAEQQQKPGDSNSAIKKMDIDVDKSSTGSTDTTSLSSSNEEFLDTSLICQPSISVGDDRLVLRRSTSDTDLSQEKSRSFARGIHQKS